jgi:hypothetical protein
MVATHLEILCFNGIRKCVHAVGKPRYLALILISSHSPSYFSKINIGVIRKGQSFSLHYTSELGLGPIRRRTVWCLSRCKATGV